MKRIVIVGAGSAGVMAANRMRREFSRDGAEITIIERSDRHIYQPGFVTLLFDLDKPENLIRATKDLFLDGINLIIDEITSIDQGRNKVTTAKYGDMFYDYLVIATGAKLYLDEPEGMKEGLEKGENMGEEVIQNSEGIGDALGWVPCHKNSLMHRSFNNIYVIGDAGNFPSAKTASGARIQAKVLAQRIKAQCLRLLMMDTQYVL